MKLNKVSERRIQKAITLPSRRAPKTETTRPNFWVRFLK